MNRENEQTTETAPIPDYTPSSPEADLSALLQWAGRVANEELTTEHLRHLRCLERALRKVIDRVRVEERERVAKAYLGPEVARFEVNGAEAEASSGGVAELLGNVARAKALAVRGAAALVCKRVHEAPPHVVYAHVDERIDQALGLLMTALQHLDVEAERRERREAALEAERATQ